jgi:hypothetical protein
MRVAPSARCRCSITSAGAVSRDDSSRVAAFVKTGDLLPLRQGHLAGLDRVLRFLLDDDGFQTGAVNLTA